METYSKEKMFTKIHRTQNKRLSDENDQEGPRKKQKSELNKTERGGIDSNTSDKDSVSSERTLMIDEWSKDETESYWMECDKCEVRHYAGGCPKRDPVCQLHIGENVYVVVNSFNGERKVHIRMYEKPVERPMYPTKRGIALDLEKWSKLAKKYKPCVDDAICRYKKKEDVDFDVHLGHNYRVTLKTGYSLVHIRRWFIPDGEQKIKPTRRGIALNFEQWDKLKDAMQCVDDLIGEEINSVQYCEDRPDHQSQLVAMQCQNCSPGFLDLIDYI